MSDELYSIGQVCELLGIENFNLRYIEKTIGIEIKRNNAGERLYSEQDLETLKFIFELKNQGLNYKAIKKVLERQEEIVSDTVENDDELGLTIKDEKLEKFMSMIKNTIEETIENKVNTKLEGITNSIDLLVKQNQDLKQTLENEQEKHFIELDRKITKWRDEKQDEKQPWFKKLLGK